jgi:hypothetical protein
MPVDWKTNVAWVLAEARKRQRAVLIDFSGGLACAGSLALDAESYTDEQVSAYVDRYFVPLRIFVREGMAEAQQFGVFWTPTVIMFDSRGTERYRIEGYLPPKEFAAHIVLALGRIAIMENDWQTADDFYVRVMEKHAGTKAAAEAAYWAGVCCYKQTKDIRVLAEMSHFNQNYKDSIWALKSSVWGR